MANYDTAYKRISGMDWGQPSDGFPTPDGTVGQRDRQHLIGLYAGILTAGAPTAPVGTLLLMGVGM